MSESDASRTGLIWIEPPSIPEAAGSLDDDPLLHRLLTGRVANRAEATEFLDPRPREAPDPLGVPGLAAVAERVAQAIEDGERIAVYGDYDVDGVTSAALLVRALRTATGDDGRVLVRLPTRAEGYGLHPAALADLASAGATLLIAVDCGSSEPDNIACARSLGLEVVVVDHHQMPGPPPAGAAVASPQLRPDGPYRELAAVGLAYLLVVSLSQWGFRVGDQDGGDPGELLDLVALGTIADVAPLVGANRALVRDGLRAIRMRPRIGIQALCQRAGVAPETITSDQVGFRIGPRLNAAGRMADPRLALDLLLTDDPIQADALAAELERLNALRRRASDEIVADAEELLRQQPALLDSRLLMIARPNWGAGVLGLAAGRLAERFRRPVLVLSEDGEIAHGSARSVKGFDITRGLRQSADLLLSHGGHSLAAGLTLPTANLTELQTALDAAIAEANLPPAGPPSIQINADLPWERLSIETARLIANLAPFGTGNPIPVLRLQGIRVRAYSTIGPTGSHLKLQLHGPDGIVPAIAWRAADRSRELVTRPEIDLLVTLSIDHWNGQRRLQVEIKDFRPTRF